eukprot:2753678-Alexandrium_andersonii.AAC.1
MPPLTPPGRRSTPLGRALVQGLPLRRRRHARQNLRRRRGAGARRCGRPGTPGRCGRRSQRSRRRCRKR